MRTRPLCILVTRPQPAAAATAAKLEALGHRAILLPMMQPVHQQQAARDALARPCAALAVTSAEAIRALTSIRADLAPHLDTPVFCVGAATADAARMLGFRSVVTGPGTGAGLADVIARSSLPGEHGLVYLAGTPRSPAFETGLLDAGLTCRVAEIYRMQPIFHPPAEIEAMLHAEKPDAALFYSRETARHFFSLLPPATAIGRLLCLSETVAEAVPAGFGTTMVATEPTEDSLLSLL